MPAQLSSGENPLPGFLFAESSHWGWRGRGRERDTEGLKEGGREAGKT